MKELLPFIPYFIASYVLMFIFGWIWRGEYEEKKREKAQEKERGFGTYNDKGKIDIYE